MHAQGRSNGRQRGHARPQPRPVAENVKSASSRGQAAPSHAICVWRVTNASNRLALPTAKLTHQPSLSPPPIHATGQGGACIMATPAPASGSNGAASASSPATGDNNDDDWGRFEARVKGLIPAMVGLTSMFTARHLPCPLRTLSGTLASVGFDVVTLRYRTRDGRSTQINSSRPSSDPTKPMTNCPISVACSHPRLLHSVAPRLLSVAHDPRDPGASNVGHACRLSNSVRLSSIHCA